jgi:hypothetical protein
MINPMTNFNFALVILRFFKLVKSFYESIYTKGINSDVRQ